MLIQIKPDFRKITEAEVIKICNTAEHKSKTRIFLSYYELKNMEHGFIINSYGSLTFDTLSLIVEVIKQVTSIDDENILIL